LRIRKVLFIVCLVHRAIYSTAQSCKALPVEEHHLPARNDGQTSQLAPEANTRSSTTQAPHPASSSSTFSSQSRFSRRSRTRPESLLRPPWW